MTLTQLRYLVALERHGNFARAAESCLVTQPTLSLQIQKLEQEAGAELFDRRTTPVTPTALGRAVIEQARAVLREADRLEDLFREAADELAGEITVGIIPTIAGYLLPQLFSTLRKKYSDVNFKFYELPTTQIVERLERDELDVGILATPLEMRGIVEEPIYYEPFVAYFGDRRPDPGTPLSLDDLKGEDLILLGEDHCFRNQSLSLCRDRGPGSIECGSIETLKKMVEAGAGVTLLPLLATSDPMRGVRRFGAPEPAREVSLVYRPGFIRRRLLRALREVVREIVPAELHERGGREVVGVNAERPVP